MADDRIRRPAGDGSSWINRLYLEPGRTHAIACESLGCHQRPTSSTCGDPAGRHWRGYGSNPNLRTEWRTSTPTAVGIAPIFHRALTVPVTCDSEAATVNTATVCAHAAHLARPGGPLMTTDEEPAEY